MDKQKLDKKLMNSGCVIKNIGGWAKEKKAIMDEVYKDAQERIKDYSEDQLVVAKKIYINGILFLHIAVAHC